MAGKRGLEPGKAMALLAYVLDMASENGVNRVMVDRLVDEVCENEGERIRLIAAVNRSQDADMPILVLELLGQRASRLRNAHEREIDNDEVYGKWGQRVAITSIAGSITLVAVGVVTGGLGALVIGGTMLSGSAISVGRSVLKTRARSAKRGLEDTERLIDLIKKGRA